MSFTGGGAGAAGETLAYMIRAYDMATPVFKAFGAEVNAVTRQVQASLAEMNRAMAGYDRNLAASAGGQKAALGEVSKAQAAAARSATGAAQTQTDAAKRATAAVNAQAAAAQRAADRQKAAALETEAAAVRTSGALQRAGRDVLLASAATVAGTVDMAAHFQANTLRMETQAGATAKGLDQIRQGLLKMAGQVGATPNQLANGMYHVVSAMNAVLPPATRVSQELAIMKIAAEGAQVGHSNLEETTYALSSALNALHKNARDAGTVMGQLNAIVGAGDMTMQDLIDSFKSGLIPAADSFHISLQSVGAALSVMGDMGMRGALAGTRLRMAISLLAAPTKQAATILETLGMKSQEALSTSEKMAQALKEAGVSTTRLSYDLKQPDGLAVALSDLNQHLQAAGLSATGAGAVISRAFGGGRMGAAITLLAENTDRLQLKFKQIGVTGQNFGDAWKKTSETFRVQLDRAVAAVEALGIRIGEVLLPYVTKGLHALEDMSNWLVRNKVVLEALGGAFIAFSSVAIGTYFVGKLKSAMNLMRDFGHSVAGTGRWLFGGGGGAGAPAIGPGGGGAGGGGGAMFGLFGYMGSPLRVGTMMNPVAVVLARGAAGAAGAAGTGTSVLPAESAESKAAAARTQATMEEMAAQQTAVDRNIATFTAGTQTTLDELLAQQAAQGEQLALFAGSAAKLEAAAMATPIGTARAGEQLGLGSVATTERSLGTQVPLVSQVPMRRLPGVIGQDPFAGLSKQEQFAMMYPGGRFGSPTSALGGEESALKASATSTLASFRTGLATIGTSLLRGGLIAGLGTLLAQTIGSAVGGGTGEAIKKIGTGAAIGGGLGSIFGPWGTALGAALGAGVGGLVSSGLFRSEGQKAADEFTKGFGTPDLKKTVAKSIDDANRQLDPEGRRARQDQLRNLTAPGHPVPTIPGPTKAQIAQAQQDSYNAGTAIAQQLEKGWNQYKFQQEPFMLLQLKAELKGQQPQIQAFGIQSAIAFSQGLEKQGRLTKGSTEILVQQLESAFPGFEKYLGVAADASAATFTKNFDLRQAETNTKTAMQKMRGDFPAVTDAMDSTAGTVQDKSVAMIHALQNIVATGSGPMAKKAQVDLDALRAANATDFSAMAALAGSKVADMRKTVGGDIGALTTFAGSAMSNFGANVFAAMSSGALSTSQAMDAMVSDTNKVLAQLGGDKLTAPQVRGLAQLQLNVQQFAAAHGGIGGGAETGGWIGSPGERGRDTVGIVVGRGEAVLKHQDQRIVNAALSRTKYGSLGGVFAANRGLTHSGAPTAMEVGGYVYPNGPGNVPERIDQGKDFGGAFNVGAIGPGTVLRNTIWNGWPGTGGVVYHLNAGVRSGQNVFVMEDFQAGVRVGQTLKAGQVVGRASGGSHGIEEGWANAAGTGPLTPYNGAPDGTPMPGGADFAAFINGLVHGVLTGAPIGALGGISIPVWTNIKAPKILGTGRLVGLEQANVNKTAARINAWGQNKVSMVGGFSGAAFAGQGGGNAANQALGHRMMRAAGFPDSDWPALLALWNQESGWNANAVNPSSGAYGIPQSLGHGHPYNLGDAPGQIAWGLNYIRQTYSPGDAIQNAWAHERSHNWYNRGGFAGNPVQYAGAFGQGGAFTTTGPTLALFGEGGRPETVMAFQAGGVVPGLATDPTRKVTVTTGPKGTTVTTTTTTTTTSGGEKTTTSHRVTQSPTGTHYSDSTTTSPVKPPKPPRPKADHFHWGFDPLTGRIEYHDTAQWQMIHAHEAQQHARAAAAKKAYDAWLAQKVTDTLMVGHLPVGDLQQTRKTLIGEHLPLGGPLSLLGNLNKVSDSGFRAISSGLGTYLRNATPDQDVSLANRFTRGMTRHGPDASLFHEIGQLTGQMHRLNTKADARQRQAETLHAKALTEHGKQRQHTMGQAHQDHLAAHTLRQKALADSDKIARLTDKIANSRTAQLGNTIIQAAAKGVTGIFSAQQAAFQHTDTIAQLIENAPAGSTARSLHLSAAQLKAAGLTPARVKALAGAASGPAALAQQVSELTSQAIPQYQADAQKLSQLYKDALRTHNKKLQASLLNQLDAVTQAQLKAYGDLATAQTAQVESVYQRSQAKTSSQQASSDILGAIQNLAPGTNLTGLGLTPSVLQGLGIGPAQAGALQGSSLAYLQNLQGQQGGKLTAAQIASAQSGTTAQNQILAAQRATDVAALSELQQQLPTLKGTAADTAQTHITDLAKSILGLTDEMNKNTDAVSKLTQATNQNTTATGAMTGQVAYTYQGQGFVAGVGLSSDETMNLGQGL